MGVSDANLVYSGVILKCVRCTLVEAFSNVVLKSDIITRGPDIRAKGTVVTNRRPYDHIYTRIAQIMKLFRSIDEHDVIIRLHVSLFGSCQQEFGHRASILYMTFSPFLHLAF